MANLMTVSGGRSISVQKLECKFNFQPSSEVEAAIWAHAATPSDPLGCSPVTPPPPPPPLLVAMVPSVSTASLPSSHSVGPLLPPNQAFLVPAGTPRPLRWAMGGPPQLRSCFGRRPELAASSPPAVSVFGRWVGVPLLVGHLLICSCWNRAHLDVARPRRNMAGEEGLYFAVGSQCRYVNGGWRQWADWTESRDLLVPAPS